MTRTPTIGLLVVITAFSACAPVLPPLNGPGALDLQHWQVATLDVPQPVSCSSIRKVNSNSDETTIFEGDRRDYADHFRLTPGRYVIAYSVWYGHAAKVSRADTVDLVAGHVYRVRSKKTFFTRKVTMWIEDRETREVLAGNR